MSLPRIGLSSCFDHADPKRKLFTNKTLLYVEQSMIEWVAAGGAIVYPIPTAPAGGPSIDRWVEDLDGLVLHGGSDVAPTSYVCDKPDDRWPGDPIRDAYELDLYKRFRSAGKPVLGICRGMQVMNVAHGGTLHQDLISAGPPSSSIATLRPMNSISTRYRSPRVPNWHRWSAPAPDGPSTASTIRAWTAWVMDCRWRPRRAAME
ncbi:MAG: gamma-glutamyl-gamma-aminobutyrate hydrolase family protein [Microthrixaceae bacterium]